MGATEEQRFLFQALPYEESYYSSCYCIRRYRFFRFMNRTSERYIIFIYVLLKYNRKPHFFFSQVLLFLLLLYLINKNAVIIGRKNLLLSVILLYEAWFSCLCFCYCLVAYNYIKKGVFKKKPPDRK